MNTPISKRRGRRRCRDTGPARRRSAVGITTVSTCRSWPHVGEHRVVGRVAEDAGEIDRRWIRSTIKPRYRTERSRPAGLRRAQPMPACRLPMIADRWPAAPMDRRNADLDRTGGTGPVPPASFAALVSHRIERCCLAGAAGCSVGFREEARFLHQLLVPLLFVGDPLRVIGLPVMKVWLKAPSLISFFHSGVSRTFLNRST